MFTPEISTDNQSPTTTPIPSIHQTSCSKHVLVFIIKEKVKVREKRCDVVGVIHDKKLKVEDVEKPHKLGGTSYIPFEYKTRPGVIQGFQSFPGSVMTVPRPSFRTFHLLEFTTRI